MNDWAPAVRSLTRFRIAGRETGGGVVLPWFPAVGAAVGLAGWVLVCLCTWLGGPRAGAVLAALLVFAYEGWVTAGRRYGAAVRLLESIPDGSGGPETSAYVRFAAFQGLIVVKLVCYGVLAATGHAAWLVVAGAVSAAAVANGLEAEPAHEIHGSDIWQAWGHWIVAGVIAAAAGRLAHALLPALFALLVALLLPGALTPLLGPEGREPGSLAWESLAEALAFVVLVIGTLAALAA